MRDRPAGGFRRGERPERPDGPRRPLRRGRPGYRDGPEDGDGEGLAPRRVPRADGSSRRLVLILAGGGGLVLLLAALGVYFSRSSGKPTTPGKARPGPAASKAAVPAATKTAVRPATGPAASPKAANRPPAAPAEPAFPPEVEDELRPALARAAGIPEKTWRVLRNMAGQLDPTDLGDYNLTAVILFFELQEELPLAEITFEEIPPPEKLRAALERHGLNSIIQEEDIVQLAGRLEGDRATGSVAFAAKDLWRGRVEFTAERRGGKWEVTEFRLPPSGMTLQRSAEGIWTIACQAWEGISPEGHEGPTPPRLEFELQGAGQVQTSFFFKTRGDLTWLCRLLERRVAHAPREADGRPRLELIIGSFPRGTCADLYVVLNLCHRLKIPRISVPGGTIETAAVDFSDLPFTGEDPDAAAETTEDLRIKLSLFESNLVRLSADDYLLPGQAELAAMLRERRPRYVVLDARPGVPIEFAAQTVFTCRQAGVKHLALQRPPDSVLSPTAAAAE